MRVNRLVDRRLDLHFPLPHPLVEDHVSLVAAGQRLVFFHRHLHGARTIAFGDHDLHEAHHIARKIHARRGVNQLPSIEVELELALVLVVAWRAVHHVHGHLARDLVALIGVVSRQHCELQKGIALPLGHELQSDPRGIDQSPHIDLNPPVPQWAVGVWLPIGRFVAVEEVGDRRLVGTGFDRVEDSRVIGEALQVLDDVRCGVVVLGHESWNNLSVSRDLQCPLDKSPITPVSLAVYDHVVGAQCVILRPNQPPQTKPQTQRQCALPADHSPIS